MSWQDLAAKVAIRQIKRALELEPDGSMRFCMLGFDGGLVATIATAAHADRELAPWLAVRIPESIGGPLDLPPDLLSNESITHWRHCQLPGQARAVLFAASQDELQRNDKSVEKIAKLETDTLRSLTEDWLQEAGLTSKVIDLDQRAHLESALRAASAAHTARTLEMFADFVINIAAGVHDLGLPPPRAVDHALPALRLPRYAAQFDRIPEKRRGIVAEWEKLFRRLNTRMPPLLVRENDRGEDITAELRENLEAMRVRLDESKLAVIEAFLAADLTHGAWQSTQDDLAKLDWREIGELFEGASKKKVEGLGERTVRFFSDEFDDALSDDERYALTDPLPKEPDAKPEILRFFEDYREHLAQDRALYSAWERYVFKSPETYQDFLVGLVATLHRLIERTGDEQLTENRLVVRLPRSQKRSFWEGKNPLIMRAFACRYNGIQGFFDENVEFDFGRLWEYYFPALDDKLAKNSSVSKEARTLKFEVELDPNGARTKFVFNWEMPVEAIATALPRDLIRIAHIGQPHALLPTANIARQAVNAKGRVQRLSLNDVNTMRDVLNSNEGDLVAVNQEPGDRAQAIREAIKALEGMADGQHVRVTRVLFEEFSKAYTQAIRDWVSADGPGLASDAFLQQAEAYGALLYALQRYANKDHARERLWKEIFSIGVAQIIGDTPAAIVPPWHPLRMAELHIKARIAATLVNDVLTAEHDQRGNTHLLFAQSERELSADFYPEVCVVDTDDGRILLTSVEACFNYSLLEPPEQVRSGMRDDALDIEPTEAARAFCSISEQYLKLLPHERSNFSIVLYDAESKALPTALASELASKVEQENELQCDLLLTHSNPTKMRRIYEQQNIAVGEDSGSVMASEAAKNFLSRLRVGFLDTGAIRDAETTRAADLVVLQDVVARNAEVIWQTIPEGHPHTLASHAPPRWSRRRPIERGGMTSAVYLVSPAQPKVGQLYLNAIQYFLLGERARSEDVIPARIINSSTGRVRAIFERTHKIGEWIVNYDELVDRRLLANNRVKVIRHIHDRHANRNIVVSTTANLKLVHALLRQRIERLDPSLVRANDDVIERLIEQATKLSGQIVMRAARYGRYANELLGVVLSMELLQSSLDASKLPIGWYFLDDYATWFGQREEQIADVMAIAPRFEYGVPIVKIAITEAKFVGSQGYRAQANKSAKQLEETVARLSNALDPKLKRLDQQTWLHRIGDFMIEGMEAFDPKLLGGWDLCQWSEKIRSGEVELRIVGFSHVFVHDDEERVDAGGVTPLSGMRNCVQQILNKHSVATLLRKFANQPAEATSEEQAVEEGWSYALIASKNEDSSEKPAWHRESGLQDPPDLVQAIQLPEGPKASPEPSALRRQETQVSDPGLDVQKSSPSPSEPADPTLIADDSKDQEARNRWPSPCLAAWVAAGQPHDEIDPEAKEWLQEKVRDLQRALRSYDMTAELIDARLTPNAGLIRFRGSNDLTVPKVEKRQQELLTSHAIDVINVLAAPREVIILARRPKRAVLRLQDLWRIRELPASAPDTNTSLMLGARESDGALLYLNVGDSFAGYEPHGPHTLIAGETGSGKGVLVQCLLLDICATNSPQSARIRMIDPKAGIDYPWLRRMPHLEGDLITDQEEAIANFEQLVAEMERRNHLLAEAGVTKLASYNRQVSQEDRLPRIWVFHDELADWMLIDNYRDAVELNASRLGVKARAAGINLVFVTQRPDKDALPMQLRANLSNRLVLKVADKKNSVLVLDEPGAERLLGRGHLAAKLSGQSEIILAQVPFVDEVELAEVAELVIEAWS